MAGKTISDREELLVCEHYSANWSLKKIAAFANLSQVTVLAILKRREIPLRAGKRLTKEQEEKVVGLYSSTSLSILDIMTATGVKSEQTIYRILRDAGTKRRRNTIKE